MRIRRYGGIAGAALAGALALTACGTNDNNSPSPSGSGGTGSAPAVANVACASGTLNASGSTAQQQAIAAWTKAYQQKCTGATINYKGNGSGAGLNDFTSKQSDFAGSDYALTAEQKAGLTRCTNNSAIDIPLVPGAIAVGYNVPGVSQQLKLSASTLAKIFTGKITKWNDQAITAENPGVQLPDLAIQTFHRGDTSGTSYNFSNYLSHDAPQDWTTGANKQWPASPGQGETGSTALAHTVQTTQGAIGYFELSYAQQDNIPFAAVGDSAGHFISPSTDTANAFLANATQSGQGNDLALTFDYSAAGAAATKYPAVLVTYEFVCAQGNDPAKLQLLKDYLGYIASPDGQGILASAGYVPLPTALQARSAQVVATLS